MIALVTGGRGFIGSHLIRALAAQGVAVIATTRRPLSDIDWQEAGVEWRHLDVSSRQAWSDIFESRIDQVYHLGWSTIPRSADLDPTSDLLDNVVSSLYLFDAIRMSGQRPRIVFTSSGGTVYGPPQIVPVMEDHPLRPMSAYGLGKVTLERYIDIFNVQHGLDAVTLRIGNPYGPGQDISRQFGVVSTFASRALQGAPLEIFGDGSHVRDYLYIDDLIAALLSAGARTGVGGAINIGSGVGVSLNEIVRQLSDILDGAVRVEYKAARGFDVPVSVLGVGMAKAKLDWIPQTPFNLGLRKTVDFLASSLGIRLPGQ